MCHATFTIRRALCIYVYCSSMRLQLINEMPRTSVGSRTGEFKLNIFHHRMTRGPLTVPSQVLHGLDKLRGSRLLKD